MTASAPAPAWSWQARIAEVFDASGFLRTLGARMTEAAPGRCTIEAAFRPDLTQHHGLFHAGVLTTLADNAAGLAALSLMPPGAEVMSVEFKINFLRPGAGVAAVARAEVLKPGRTLTTCRADIHMRQQDGREVLAATMLATMMSAAPEPRTMSAAPEPRTISATPEPRTISATPEARTISAGPDGR